LSVASRLDALSPEQRALLEELRRRQAARAGAPSRRPPPVAPRSGRLGLGDWPLSFDQERLWRLHRDDPGMVCWNVDACSEVSGELDVARFLAAVRVVVRRHAAWRATFPLAAGRPVQRVVEFLAPEASLLDLRPLPAARRGAEARRALYDHTRRPFDLANGPLLRLALVRLAEREHLFLLTIHHLATDWVSFQIFFRELIAAHDAPAGAAAGPHGGATDLGQDALPAVQYPDFVLWERDWLQGEVLAAEQELWRRQLAGFPLVLELPADRPRPPVQSQRGGLCAVRAGAVRSERLRALARAEGATPFMAMLAALAALLAGASGRKRLLIGSNGANRARPELEPVAGCFLVQIPFACDLTGDPTFRELLARCRRVALAAYAHQNLPFAKLIEAVAAPQAAADRSRHPIVQVMLLVLPPQLPDGAGGLVFRPVGLYDGNSRWDLLFGLYDDPRAGLHGALEYNADVFAHQRVERLLAGLYALLDAVVAEPDARISRLARLAAAGAGAGGGA